MSVAPPRPRLPSLNAVRAFEAAARHGGFARAADELSVSPGAITQQIKLLEDWVGADLFTRQPQGVVLSPLGEEARPRLTQIFDDLSRVTLDLKAAAQPETLHIAALPSIAQLWLLPRMPHLRAAFPASHLSITALERPPNLTREDYDIAIFMGATQTGIVLEEDMLQPVCAPSYSAQLSDPTVLHDSVWAQDWQTWSAATGHNIRATREAHFSLYAIAVEEARQGAGVLIGHVPLIRSALKDGTLIPAFGPAIPTGNAITADVRSGPKAKFARRVLDMLKTL